MKASWLLIPCLVSVLAIGESPVRHRAGEAPPLATALQHLHDALAAQDIDAAVRALDRAHRVAAASKRWEDLLEIGYAVRGIEEIERVPDSFESRARTFYLAALARAREQGSLDGVFRAAEAFAGLDDREGVEQSLRVAEALVSFNPEAQADLRALVHRLADSR